ncbi:MAG: phage structural protein [Enterobacteriaceae bacterium]
MASVLTGTYKGDQVYVSVGPVLLSGFGEGGAITVKREGDLYSKKVGIDGSVARARNADKTGSVEIKLLQTSKANDELSALFYVDNFTEDGSPVLSITVLDGSGRTLCYAGQAWLKTLPTLSFGKEIGERTWAFDCADLKVYVGGN